MEKRRKENMWFLILMVSLFTIGSLAYAGTLSKEICIQMDDSTYNEVVDAYTDNWGYQETLFSGFTKDGQPIYQQNPVSKDAFTKMALLKLVQSELQAHRSKLVLESNYDYIYQEDSLN